MPILEDISAEEYELKPFWMQPFFYRLLRNTKVLQMAIRTDVPGDGKCFFHCVSDQLKQLGMQPSSHAQLRSDLVCSLQNLVSDRKNGLAITYAQKHIV